MPEAWQGNTGRMWGKWGTWPTDEAERFDVTNRAGWILRRWIRNRIVAAARQELHQAQQGRLTPHTVRRILAARKRLSRARRMLKCSGRSHASVIPMSEFIKEDDSARMLFKLVDNHMVSVWNRD
jgi:hypothetical protein